MDSHIYLSILKKNLHTSVGKVGLLRYLFYFQEDNDPKHTAKDVKLRLWFNTKHMPTPPQSPDLNPIGNISAYLELKVRKHHVSSQFMLKQALQKELQKIVFAKFRNLLKSMPRCLDAVQKFWIFKLFSFIVKNSSRINKAKYFCDLKIYWYF